MDINIKLSLPPMYSNAGISNLAKGAVKVDQKNSRMMPMPEDSEFLKYTVKKGDTVFSIAKEFGVTPQELEDFLNEKEGSDSLYEGKEIEIPNYVVEKELLESDDLSNTE